MVFLSHFTISIVIEPDQMAKLRDLLASLLKADHVRALATLDSRSARLCQTIEDFALLNESNRTQVLAFMVEARAAIQTARFATGIRDRIQR